MIVQAPAAVVTTRKMNMVGWSIIVLTIIFLIVGVSVLAAGIVKAGNCNSIVQYDGFFETQDYRNCTEVAASEIIAGVVILVAGLIFSCISCCACTGALCFADDVIIQQQPLAIMTTQNGQVQYAQPMQPMYANAQQLYAPQGGQPMYAQPVQGQPMHGQSVHGQPMQGQPASGYPVAPQVYPQGYIPQQQMYASQQSPAVQHYSSGAQQTNEGFANAGPPASPSHKA